MKIKHTFDTIAVMVAIAPLGLGVSMPARAADFYVFESTAPYEMVVIDPIEIQNLDNGNRIASLWYVTVDMTQNLDVTKVEMDCKAPRFRVIAETLYYGFKPTARQIDKTGANQKGWRAVGDGALFNKYQTYVCAWPDVDSKSSKVQFPDIWSVTKVAADFLWDQKLKDQERKIKP
ncbi:MAG: hypothetical protein M1527_02180 [Gammaproteobacteria bacterium]|nr:hypothetical protein [Gammaproteobacteria bacterium]